MAAVDLLLVGRDGNGKSSVGNSILSKKAFAPRSNSSRSSDGLKKDSTKIDGLTVTVVDGISLRDHCTDGPEKVLDIISQANNAVQMFPKGFTALLVVLQYGVRFTNQEKQAVGIIKSLFGNDVLKKYGVIVMSYGDSFASDMEDDGTTFDDWCRKQTGDVKDLFEECGKRYVLFNNRTKENGKINEQIRNLMSIVKKMKSAVPSYDITSFEEAKPGRNKMIVASKLPQLEKETERFLGSVTQAMRSLEEGCCPPDEYLQNLNDLETRIEGYKAHLQEEDKETQSTKPLLDQISITEASLATKKQRCLLNQEIQIISRSQPSPPPPSTQPQRDLVITGATGAIVVTGAAIVAVTVATGVTGAIVATGASSLLYLGYRAYFG